MELGRFSKTVESMSLKHDESIPIQIQPYIELAVMATHSNDFFSSTTHTSVNMLPSFGDYALIGTPVVL